MRTLSQTHERRVRPLNPTFVPYLLAFFLPLMLLLVLLWLSSSFFPHIRREMIRAALTQPGSTQPIARIGDATRPSGLTLFAPEVQAWEDAIFRWSEQYHLPPALIATVMQIESCGSAHAISSAGAMGLFQVMPFHFNSSEDPFDPEVNAARGLDYLARAFDIAQGDIGKTLAGYNGGHSTIAWEPAEWPAETRRYVDWGTGIWEEVQSAHAQSATLSRWLDAGGKHLCQQTLNVINQ